MEDNNGGAVAGSFTLSATLPNGKQLTFSGYVIQGEGDAEVNAKLDFASRAVERQRLIAEIPVLEATLQGKQDAIEQVTVQMHSLNAKLKKTGNDENQIGQHLVNLEHLKKQVVQGQDAIDKARKLAATA